MVHFHTSIKKERGVTPSLLVFHQSSGLQSGYHDIPSLHSCLLRLLHTVPYALFSCIRHFWYVRRFCRRCDDCTRLYRLYMWFTVHALSLLAVMIMSNIID